MSDDYTFSDILFPEYILNSIFHIRISALCSNAEITSKSIKMFITAFGAFVRAFAKRLIMHDRCNYIIIAGILCDTLILIVRNIHLSRLKITRKEISREMMNDLLNRGSRRDLLQLITAIDARIQDGVHKLRGQLHAPAE